MTGLIVYITRRHQSTLKKNRWDATGARRLLLLGNGGDEAGGGGGDDGDDARLLESLGRLHLVERLDGFDADEIGKALALVVVFVSDVTEVGGRAASLAKVGDAHARAVELADDVHGRAWGFAVGGDEVAGPDERERLAGEPHRLHEHRDVVVNKLRLEVGVLGGVRRVEGGDVDAAHGGHAALHRLLVDNLEEGVLHHEHANLALRDAGEEALVDELAARLL
eukprot:CAMPEP_0170132432 /NCGR_PEP_ID=MMETSP0033_2-20121228/196_1 /TAXON_ID=195969 /ORGANISM="Dolichomastix tenuilepis, Strain CCMP3274" /LENGTH=222 /DNA_ID=CAMNT_0010367785 /DNA_START=24 /DNA_END=688 /DNA_ORIENTATION=-